MMLPVVISMMNDFIGVGQQMVEFIPEKILDIMRSVDAHHCSLCDTLCSPAVVTVSVILYGNILSAQAAGADGGGKFCRGEDVDRVQH